MHDELTKVDIQKMQEEIDEIVAKRPALRAALQAARELGDLSENDEYRSAKRELNRANSRISYLEAMIKTAIVISAESKDDEVGLFDEITVYYPDDDEEEVIRIVTTLRNDVLKNCISKESPVGTALLGRKVGETVTVKVNDKFSYPIVVKSIKKGEDDASLEISKY